MAKTRTTFKAESPDHDNRVLMLFPYDGEVVAQVTTPTRSYQSTLSKNDVVDLIGWLARWLAEDARA